MVMDSGRGEAGGGGTASVPCWRCVTGVIVITYSMY